ncbi:HET-domain-containing protein, partial [Stipitochalara longipes BDJ]
MTRKKYSSTQLPDSLSFRIAILSPGEFDDVLTMTLEVRNLSEQDLDYEAISYCWSQGIGDAIEDTWDFHVKCGEDTFMVPRNLGRALRRLRYQDKQRRLWMDSVCIDQQSVEEKNVQVAMMGRIFAQARRVVVWLGEQD